MYCLHSEDKGADQLRVLTFVFAFAKSRSSHEVAQESVRRASVRRLVKMQWVFDVYDYYCIGSNVSHAINNCVLTHLNPCINKAILCAINAWL